MRDSRRAALARTALRLRVRPLGVADRGRLMACATCGAPTSPTTNGTPRKYCDPCRRDRQLAASRRWKHRNAQRLQEYQRSQYAVKRAYYLNKGRRRRLAKTNEIKVYRRHLYESRQKASNAEAVRDYRQRNPGKHAEIENRRRARLLAAFVAPVDPDAIWGRHGGTCQICGKPVKRSEATNDHIVPLARGGTHEPSNVQLAHGSCNSRKGDRLDYAAPTAAAG
jgi:5-methylcytosine-specific restriction endonuclease McrA